MILVFVMVNLHTHICSLLRIEKDKTRRILFQWFLVLLVREELEDFQCLIIGSAVCCGSGLLGFSWSKAFVPSRSGRALFLFFLGTHRSLVIIFFVTSHIVSLKLRTYCFLVFTIVMSLFHVACRKAFTAV